jgi:hypothetical protein
MSSVSCFIEFADDAAEFCGQRRCALGAMGAWLADMEAATQSRYIEAVVRRRLQSMRRRGSAPLTRDNDLA